jgi:hypothetical protein
MYTGQCIDNCTYKQVRKMRGKRKQRYFLPILVLLTTLMLTAYVTERRKGGAPRIFGKLKLKTGKGIFQKLKLFTLMEKS